MLGKIFRRDTKATAAATPPPPPAPRVVPAAAPVSATPAAPVSATPVGDGPLPVPEHPAETVRFQARRPQSIAPNKTLLAATLAGAGDWTNPLPVDNPRRRAITKPNADPKPPTFAGGDGGEIADEPAGHTTASQEDL